MRVLRAEYNRIVEEIKRGSVLADQTEGRIEVLCLLKSIPSSVNNINISPDIDVNTNNICISFEFELLNSTSDALVEKCLDLLQICDTDEYAKFLIYRLHAIYDSKLDTISSSQVYLNTIKSILEKDTGYIPTDILRLKKVLLSAPYSYTKQKIVEKLQDKVDIGLHSLKFTPIDEEFCDEIISWNIVVASNRFVTIRFDTFMALTGINESQLLHNVCKLAAEKKIVVQIDQVGKVLSFPLNKVDLQHELNNFFKVYLPNTLEQNFTE